MLLKLIAFTSLLVLICVLELVQNQDLIFFKYYFTMVFLLFYIDATLKMKKNHLFYLFKKKK